MSARAWVFRLVLLLVAVFLAFGVVASWRAFFPVSRVHIEVPGGVLRAGGEVWIESVSSGRGPVRLRLEALQGGRTELLASARIATRRWAFWDPRPVRHSTGVALRREMLGRLAPGAVTLRVTAIGAPAWLRQPPPTVEQLEVQCQP